jgi:hypothetical protein
VLMLVYIDTASPMNSLDPGGGVHCDELSLEIKAALKICFLSCGILLEFVIGP